MIGADLAEAQALRNAFKDALSPMADSMIGAFDATAVDPEFPGALFVWPGDGVRPPVFYGAAQSQAQWRRLRPLLKAFVGPTLTNFAGEVSALDPSLRHERILGTAGLAAVARMVPASGTASSTERALNRLVALVAKTPPDAEPPMETTGRILARIQDHLNALAIGDAWQLLDRCRSEHRLDALNLKFLEVEILATARDWRGISELKGFDDLFRTRRPPAVTSALLESIYWMTFEDAAPITSVYVAGPRKRVRDLIRLPAPAGMRDGAWRLYALEALAQGRPNFGLAEAATTSGADLSDLADALASLIDEVPNFESRATAATIAEALIVADVSSSLNAIDQARSLLALLTDDERAALLQSEQPRRALQAINETFGTAPSPQSWPAWLGELQNPTFTTAQAVARQAATEWYPSLGDPVEIARLADSLVSVPDHPPACDRLIDGIPHLVAWLQRDPEFPRPVGYNVYEAALERLMLSGRTAAPMMDSAGVLARAMLAIGPAPAAYGRLLSDLLDFSGQAAGVRTAYWLMELAEDTVAANTPDQTAREQFWQGVVSRLVPVGSQLSTLQRASLSRLNTMLGREGTLPDALKIGPSTPSDVTLSSRLAGKIVAIYTLTESAGAQAAEALLTIAPEVDVRVNSDHGGSRPLRALAENADLFVVVAASATHAATDFIRAKRGTKPLRYTAGRGAISIVRAVEDWAFRSDKH